MKSASVALLLLACVVVAALPRPSRGDGSVTTTQIFRYTIQEIDGTDFRVDLPAAFANDQYEVFVSQVSVTYTVQFWFPDTDAGDRTSSSFRVMLDIPLAEGDSIAFLVVPRT